MPALLSPNAKQQFFTDGSTVAAGFRLHTYAAGTTTPQATYADRNFGAQNQNPITLDARGEAVIYLTPGIVYDYVLKTDQGATVWTRPGVSNDAASGLVFASDRGVQGNASDETAKLQALFDSAAGKILHLEAGKTYGLTTLTIPTGTTLVSNGAKFKKLVASSTYGITVKDRVVADLIDLEIPGSSVDAGLRISGGDVDIGYARVVSLTQDSGSGMSVHGLNLTGTGTRRNIKIGGAHIENFVGSMFVESVDGIDCGRIVIDTYKTGVYLRDVKNGTFTGAHISGIGATGAGGPGENGLLLEAWSPTATENLVFIGWHIQDSGEHAFRIGGDHTVRNIHYRGCSSLNTGAIAGVSTGGAAFKALHGSANGTAHVGIFVSGFLAEDCSEAGTGLNNHAAFQIGNCKGVELTDVVIRRRNNPTYSCKFGFQVFSSEDVQINNPNVTDCMRNAVQIIEAGAATPAYPAFNRHIHVNGGKLQVVETTASVVKVACGASVFNAIKVNGTTMIGGNAAVVHDAPGTGSYLNNEVICTYLDPANTSGGPPFSNSNAILLNVRAPFYGTFQPLAANGSIYQDTTNGLTKIRKAGAWNTL